MDYDELLIEEFRHWKLDLPTGVRQKLADYASQLEQWNKAVNLTALQGIRLVRRLIVEPIWVGHRLQMSGKLMDVGSGNGSPGIPLAITSNFEHVLLVEPRLKRTAFLRHVIAKLMLRNTEVARERVENLQVGLSPPDWITLQAIDPNEDIILSLKKLSMETTRVVWLTSRDHPPIPAAEKIELPESSNKIWIFRLDQS